MPLVLKDINPKLVKGKRILCPKCGKGNAVIDQTFGVMMCKKCHQKEYAKSTRLFIHRKRLTDWEKKKLSWYRNEKEWIEDIKGRRIMPNGDIGVYSPDGKLKEIRPAKGGYYGKRKPFR
jgi:hypothetical protein